MKKMIALMLLLSGCISAHRASLYRTALKDTNQILTETRDQNEAMSRVIQRQHRIIQALKMARRTEGYARD